MVDCMKEYYLQTLIAPSVIFKKCKRKVKSSDITLGSFLIDYVLRDT